MAGMDITQGRTELIRCALAFYFVISQPGGSATSIALLLQRALHSYCNRHCSDAATGIAVTLQ